MSFEVVTITDFVETLIFALRATLKKGLEESASHHVIFFCAAALGIAPICNSIRIAYWGSPRAPQKESEQKNDRDPFDWLLKLWRQFPA